ncbi:hypothetical protein OH76DRAFT_1399004 [Lentinus brumalis]|uniref:Uncharacterized protein n=1 Tax=Lentinus brumalis TaxID=2498619 RepID=A0A371DMV0_9APHY|nr:hypothetical protein OH76DRAFT_1399004 [Polyporus brumalis]
MVEQYWQAEALKLGLVAVSWAVVAPRASRPPATIVSCLSSPSLLNVLSCHSASSADITNFSYASQKYLSR